MIEWQTMDTAPKDGSLILVALYYPNGQYWGQDIVWWNDHWNNWDSAGYDWVEADKDDEQIRYWMLLPEPPK